MDLRSLYQTVTHCYAEESSIELTGENYHGGLYFQDVHRPISSNWAPKISQDTKGNENDWKLDCIGNDRAWNDWNFDWIENDPASAITEEKLKSRLPLVHKTKLRLIEKGCAEGYDFDSSFDSLKTFSSIDSAAVEVTSDSSLSSNTVRKNYQNECMQKLSKNVFDGIPEHTTQNVTSGNHNQGEGDIETPFGKANMSVSMEVGVYGLSTLIKSNFIHNDLINRCESSFIANNFVPMKQRYSFATRCSLESEQSVTKFEKEEPENMTLLTESEAHEPFKGEDFVMQANVSDVTDGVQTCGQVELCELVNDDAVRHGAIAGEAGSSKAIKFNNACPPQDVMPAIRLFQLPKQEFLESHFQKKSMDLIKLIPFATVFNPVTTSIVMPLFPFTDRPIPVLQLQEPFCSRLYSTLERGGVIGLMSVTLLNECNPLFLLSLKGKIRKIFVRDENLTIAEVYALQGVLQKCSIPMDIHLESANIDSEDINQLVKSGRMACSFKISEVHINSSGGQLSESQLSELAKLGQYVTRRITISGSGLSNKKYLLDIKHSFNRPDCKVTSGNFENFHEVLIAFEHPLNGGRTSDSCRAAETVSSIAADADISKQEISFSHEKSKRSNSFFREIWNAPKSNSTRKRISSSQKRRSGSRPIPSQKGNENTIHSPDSGKQCNPVKSGNDGKVLHLLLKLRSNTQTPYSESSYNSSVFSGTYGRTQISSTESCHSEELKELETCKRERVKIKGIGKKYEDFGPNFQFSPGFHDYGGVRRKSRGCKSCETSLSDLDVPQYAHLRVPDIKGRTSGSQGISTEHCGTDIATMPCADSDQQCNSIKSSDTAMVQSGSANLRCDSSDGQLSESQLCGLAKLGQYVTKRITISGSGLSNKKYVVDLKHSFDRSGCEVISSNNADFHEVPIAFKHPWEGGRTSDICRAADTACNIATDVGISEQEVSCSHEESEKRTSNASNSNPTQKRISSFHKQRRLGSRPILSQKCNEDTPHNLESDKQCNPVKFSNDVKVLHLPLKPGTEIHASPCSESSDNSSEFSGSYSRVEISSTESCHSEELKEIKTCKSEQVKMNGIGKKFVDVDPNFRFSPGIHDYDGVRRESQGCKSCETSLSDLDVPQYVHLRVPVIKGRTSDGQGISTERCGTDTATMPCADSDQQCNSITPSDTAMVQSGSANLRSEIQSDAITEPAFIRGDRLHDDHKKPAMKSDIQCSRGNNVLRGPCDNKAAKHYRIHKREHKDPQHGQVRVSDITQRIFHGEQISTPNSGIGAAMSQSLGVVPQCSCAELPRKCRECVITRSITQTTDTESCDSHEGSQIIESKQDKPKCSTNFKRGETPTSGKHVDKDKAKFNAKHRPTSHGSKFRRFFGCISRQGSKQIRLASHPKNARSQETEAIHPDEVCINNAVFHSEEGIFISRLWSDEEPWEIIEEKFKSNGYKLIGAEPTKLYCGMSDTLKIQLLERKNQEYYRVDGNQSRDIKIADVVKTGFLSQRFMIVPPPEELADNENQMGKFVELYYIVQVDGSPPSHHIPIRLRCQNRQDLDNEKMDDLKKLNYDVNMIFSPQYNSSKVAHKMAGKGATFNENNSNCTSQSHVKQ